MNMTGQGFPGRVAGTFAAQPKGVILHGSRSGKDRSIQEEYLATIGWASNPKNEFGWNATGGEREYCVHMTAKQWGWHARSPASETYLSYEFAQPLATSVITADQIAVFLRWWQEQVLPVWPSLTLTRTATSLLGHSELPAGIKDGKTDPYPKGHPRLIALKRDILIGSVQGDTFSVGEGVRAAMTKLGDVPLSDEDYSLGVISITAGTKYLYAWHEKANKVYRLGGAVS